MSTRGVSTFAPSSSPDSIGGTIFLPVNVTDLGCATGPIDGVIEFRLQAERFDIESNGIFFRQVIFDDTARGGPVSYQESVTYPEGLVNRVPQPSVTACARVGLTVLGLLRRRP
jgi:hypothetical protein